MSCARNIAAQRPPSRRLGRLLGMRGIHYLVTRFGGPRLRALSFDQKYIGGEWDLDHHSPEATEIAAVLSRYAGGGDILDLGCGTGLFVDLLPEDRFSSYLGVDLSAEALALARERRSARASFVLADVARYEPPAGCRFDVVLFRESLYYVPARQRVPLLRRYAHHLKPGGVFVVTVRHPGRFGGMLRAIRDTFGVLEDRHFSPELPCLLVFRQRPSYHQGP